MFTCMLQVCLSKEKEERVRLELRVTELEEEMEAQTMQIKSVKCVSSYLYMHVSKPLEPTCIFLSCVEFCVAWHYPLLFVLTMCTCLHVCT